MDDHMFNKIEELYEWSYVESEGQHCMRYDFLHTSGQMASLWVYENGSIDGLYPKSIEKELNELVTLTV
jgi:hypothetical protein